MELQIYIYFKNKKSGKFSLLRETITEDDIMELARQKALEDAPMWMTEDHEFHSVEIDEIRIK